MRTLLGHPEPPPRGTVYTSTAALPLDVTLVDTNPAALFPINRRPATQTSTTLGWIRFDAKR